MHRPISRFGLDGPLGWTRPTSQISNVLSSLLTFQAVQVPPAAQNYFMASGQRLSPECERDSAGSDRAKFHAPLLSFERSMRTTPARPARPPCAGASVIRDGTESSATSNSAGSCAGCSARGIGSAVVKWLSQPPAHRHAFERQRSGAKQTDVACLSAEHPVDAPQPVARAPQGSRPPAR
jgi:hypothetical protein